LGANPVELQLMASSRLSSNPMSALERRSVGVLAGIYALRMAGLFLIFPVFALYAEGLSGQTPALIGLALGAYGLTQAILQIPYGIASDRFGRKPLILLGLLIFAAGSAVAAMSTSIWGVILGRALQGAGAIAAAVMALVADLTREEQRNKAMAIIGVSIGAAMMLSLVLGPVLAGLISVRGIFWLTAGLSLVAAVVLLTGVPKPVRSARAASVGRLQQFVVILRDKQLLRLDAGIFVLHLVITALFLVLPHTVVVVLGLPASAQWKLYLPVMIAGVIGMIPFLLVAGRERMRAVLVGAVLTLFASQVLLYYGHASAMLLVLALGVFFTAFNLLEATLPSLISRVAPPDSKGAAIGIYSASQFLGAFAGGAVGGVVLGRYGVSGVFVFTAIGAVVWLVLVASMPALNLLASRTLNVGQKDAAGAERLARALSAVPGVAEAVVLGDEGVAYLKVDTRALDESQLQQVVGSA